MTPENILDHQNLIASGIIKKLPDGSLYLKIM